MNLKNKFKEYISKFLLVIENIELDNIEILTNKLIECYKKEKTVFICGNGGSAANALHWANDFSYPITGPLCKGIKMNALCSNTAVMTCLGNDIGYNKIYAHQLNILGNQGDLLIVLSGSGNSENVLQAIEVAKEKNITTISILGFDGGKCKEKSDISIHIKTNNMQYAEDAQLVINHMLMTNIKNILNNEKY